MCLHDETSQKEDIVDYIKSVVYSDSEQVMKRWKTDVKDSTVKKLSDGANRVAQSSTFWTLIRLLVGLLI